MSKRWEIFLIRFASWILKSRNIDRAMFISRKDNDDTWYMSERLGSIAKRMECNYEQDN